MKSPLRDNLNFKSLRVVKELIPPKSRVDSFLFYSGAMEFNLAEAGSFVVAHTNCFFIYEFWQCALEDPLLIAEEARHYFKLLKDDSCFAGDKFFMAMQENWAKQRGSYTRSAHFFLLNRCSESALISSGKLNTRPFNSLALSNLKSFSAKNFHVQFDRQDNFVETLKTAADSDCLLLPVGRYNYNLLEHGRSAGAETTVVHHQKLYENLREQKKSWIVLYKNHSDVFNLYKDYNIIMVDKYGRKTNRKDKCEDIVIANF